jgi:nucleoside-diphosphate-sugar epimerase
VTTDASEVMNMTATAQDEGRSVPPLRGKRIVITGITGQIAFPLGEYLARDNEVFGVARFTADGSLERVEAAGIRPVVTDLADADYAGIPVEADHLVHLAAYMQPGSVDYDLAIRQNAEATGLLLEHCRRYESALVMSTHSVYKPVDDPWHVFAPTDPLGDVNAFSPTYSISKIGQEAVARTMARILDLPVTIARMNASYGPNGGLPAYQFRTVAEGRPIVTRWDPCPYQPIHQDDIDEQLAGLLHAASVPATILNWAGDEQVTVQEWAAYMGQLVGREAEVQVVVQPGTLRGSCADVSARLAAAGPCRVGWREGLRRLAAAHG